MRRSSLKLGWVAAMAILLAFSGGAGAKAEKVKVSYSVKKGDTLLGISKRFGVTVDDIVDWNDALQEKIAEQASQIDEKSLDQASFKLKPGMKLKIPGKPSGKQKTITYTVKKGDSLWAIGKKYHVKPQVIVKWNSDLADDGASGQKKGTITVDEAAQYLKPGMTLKVPGKPSGSGKKVLEHKVAKGESLWAIGKKYHVKPQVLVKWNPDKLGGGPGKGGTKQGKKGKSVDLDSLPVLQPGMELTIHAVRPDAGDRIAVLEVKKGHTPNQVANLYDVDLKDLLAHNFLLPKDKLKAGTLLEVPLPVTKKDTKSVGAPNSGKLVAGELMPAGPGYKIRKPQLAYGTTETINSIIQCIGHVQKSFPNTHDMVIGHLSKKGGGKLFPHKSHQSGRDVDLGYYNKSVNPDKFFVADSANFDVARNAALVQCFVDSGKVKYIFINTYIQKWLFKYFQNKKYSASFLTDVFQYPAEPPKQLGIVRHAKGHDDHMHVRFVCDENDTACHD